MRGPAGGRPGTRHGFEVALTILLVGAIVAAAHWPVLRAQALSLDDNAFVTYNPLVTNPGWPSIRRFFVEVLSPSTVKGYYLPLSMTSLTLDYAMGGRPEDLRAFHRTNLALHVLNTALIVLLLYHLFGALAPAAIAGLLFGVHPLTVEPVAWIGERKTLLAAFFALTCLLSYVRHCRRGGRAWLPASVALYLLALLSKPTVATLPLLLLLLDYWPLKRLHFRKVVEKWSFFVLSLISGVITLISHHRTAGIEASALSSLQQWPLQACYLLAFYLGKTVWPTNLSCVYPHPAAFAFSNPVVLASVVAVCVLTILLVLASRRSRGPLTGWLFFVFALAPTLGLVKYSWVVASDKYVYFPALGILMVLAWGLTIAWDSRRLGGLAARALLLLPLLLIFAAEARGVRVTLRNWTDSLTLCRHMEKVAPDAPPVHNQLGVLLGERGKREEAIRHLRQAVARSPEYAEAQYNLGLLLLDRGQIGDAIPHLHKASELLPDDAEAACLFGISLYRGGRLDEAEAQLRRAFRLKPDYGVALDQLGGVLVVQGHKEEAVEQFRRALAIAPNDALLHFRLASALALLGGHDSEAASHLRQAVLYKPDWPEAANALAWLLATSPDPATRDPREALRLAGRAVELTGHRDPKVLDTLAAAQAAAGRFGLAVQTARRAMELALQSRAEQLGQEIRARVRLYERGTAYTEPAGAGSKPPRSSTPE